MVSVTGYGAEADGQTANTKAIPQVEVEDGFQLLAAVPGAACTEVKQ
jgi:hypothetical protein